MTSFAAALTWLPGLLAVIRDRVTPGTPEAESQRRPPGAHRSTPLRLEPFCDVEESLRILAEAAVTVRSLTGACFPGKTSMPPGASPREVAEHTGRICGFLLHHAPSARDKATAQDIEVDIITLYEKLASKYPLKAPPERVEARCARCLKLDLYQHPPEAYQGDQTWRCSSCGKWHTEVEVVEQRAAWEREMKRKR